MKVTVRNTYRYYSNIENYNNYGGGSASSQATIVLHFSRSSVPGAENFIATGVCDPEMQGGVPNYKSVINSLQWDDDPVIDDNFIGSDKLVKQISRSTAKLTLNVSNVKKLLFDCRENKGNYNSVDFKSISALTGSMFFGINMSAFEIKSDVNSIQTITADTLFKDCNIETLTLSGNLSIDAKIIDGGNIGTYNDNRSTYVAYTKFGSFRNLSNEITLNLKDSRLSGILGNFNKGGDNSKKDIIINDNNLEVIDNLFRDDNLNSSADYFKVDLKLNSSKNITISNFGMPASSNEKQVTITSNTNVSINGGLELYADTIITTSGSGKKTFKDCFNVCCETAELILDNSDEIYIEGEFLSRAPDAISQNSNTFIKVLSDNTGDINFEGCNYIGRDKNNTLINRIRPFKINFNTDKVKNTQNCEVFYDFGGATNNRNQKLNKKSEYTPIKAEISGLSVVKGILNSFNAELNFDPNNQYGEYVLLNINDIVTVKDTFCTSTNNVLNRYYKNTGAKPETDQSSYIFNRNPFYLLVNKFSKCETVYCAIVIGNLPSSFKVNNYDNGPVLRTRYYKSDTSEWRIPYYSVKETGGSQALTKSTLFINTYGPIYKDCIPTNSGYNYILSMNDIGNIFNINTSSVSRYAGPENYTTTYQEKDSWLYTVYKIKLAGDYISKYPSIKGIFY